MDCPSCGMAIPENATFCAHCGWRVAGEPLERAAHNVAKVGREFVRTGVDLAKRTGQAMEPVVRTTAKAITETARPIVDKAKPVVEKVVKASRGAVDEGVKLSKKAIDKTAEVAETAARKVRPKAK